MASYDANPSGRLVPTVLLPEDVTKHSLEEKDHQLPNTMRNLFVALDIVFLLLIVVGNLAIIVTILRKRKFRRESGFIFALFVAVSHLLIGLVVLPMFVLDHFPDSIPSPVCKAMRYFEALAHTASPYFALVATLDMFLIHMDYRDGSLPLRTTLCQCAAVWLWAAIYAIRAPILSDSVKETYLYLGRSKAITVRYCETPEKFQPIADGFIWADLVLMFLIPLLIAYALHLRLLKHIWWSTRHEHSMNIKRTSTLVVLIILFSELVCHLPEYVWKIYVYWGPGVFENAYTLLTVVELVSFAKGWLNVFLVLAFSREVRTAVCACCCPSAIDEDEEEEEEKARQREEAGYRVEGGAEREPMFQGDHQGVGYKVDAPFIEAANAPVYETNV